MLTLSAVEGILVLALTLQDPPPAVKIEGVPSIPAEMTERLSRYGQIRSAAFEDFAPDGSVLVSTRFGETSQLHRVPFPGGRREQVTFETEPVAGGISVPGGDVLFSKARGGDENWQIWRLDRKSGRTTLLTDGKSRNTVGPLSRKGDRLVYGSTRRNGRDTDLYLLDVATGESSLLLEAKGEFWTATDWSPDDAKLLLLKTVSVNESQPFIFEIAGRVSSALPVPPGKAAHGAPKFGLESTVHLSSDAGGEFRQLLSVDLAARTHAWLPFTPACDVTDLEVSPKGGRAVVRNEDGASRLWVERPNDQDFPDLPTGVVSGLKFSPDGKRLGFTLSRADAPADAYTYEIDRRNLVRWTYSETGGLDAASFVKPERIAVKSFDGRPVPAYLYRPAREGKVPVVMTIHGGPEAQFRPSFNAQIQSWVNELGVAVLAPNVRGSTGYGKTYVALDNAEKREDAVKDVGALLDWVAKDPKLDASRVAVVGGSYGGYMSLASLVHHGARLKAGVDIVGIANFTTFLEKTSGYRVDLRRVEYGDERIPEMRTFFEKISPVNHAEKITSALLVAHGRNDPRVPFAEAEQIVAKVRAAGRDVWTVYADNEGHGFARKENRDYLNAAIALFLRKHLLEP
jgi:dipeptidyl aminopeptidase/acylaminoacyl peptidase